MWHNAGMITDTPPDRDLTATEAAEVEREREGARQAAMREPAKKTWFFERMGDGKVFAAEEAEAWDICNNQSNWKRRDFRLLGVSDGTTYKAMVQEGNATAQRLAPAIAASEKEATRLTDAINQLVTANAVDMEHVADAKFEDKKDKEYMEAIKKVRRLKVMLDRIEDKLDELTTERDEAVQDVILKAFAAELEIARGNIEWPGPVNIATPNASEKDRRKILTLMEGRG